SPAASWAVMIAAPLLTPWISPVVALIVATDVGLMVHVMGPGFARFPFASHSVSTRGGSKSPTNTESRIGYNRRTGRSGFEGDKSHAPMAAAATVSANRCGLIVARWWCLKCKTARPGVASAGKYPSGTPLPEKRSGGGGGRVAGCGAGGGGGRCAEGERGRADEGEDGKCPAGNGGMESRSGGAGGRGRWALRTSTSPGTTGDCHSSPAAGPTAAARRTR